jgi:hypothetical protein
VIENLAAVSEWASRTNPPDAIYRAVVEWVIAVEAVPNGEHQASPSAHPATSNAEP